MTVTLAQFGPKRNRKDIFLWNCQSGLSGLTETNLMFSVDLLLLIKLGDQYYTIES